MSAMSGGVPGPATLHGTARSGVAVSLADLLDAKKSGDEAKLAKAKATTEIIWAHEGGHYLGLYHTTERNGQALSSDGNAIVGKDPLSDTAVCPDSADGDGDKVLKASECSSHDGGNLMFWSPGNDARTLTSHQGSVLTKSAIVQ